MPVLPWGLDGSGAPCGFHGIPSCFAIPSGDIALPLGEHLLPATWEQILKGEFVGFFSLLFREVEKKNKELLELLDDKEKEILKH